MNRITNFLFKKPASPITLAQTATKPDCTNCGSVLTGAYCSSCGQKKIGKHDVSVGAFLGHTFHEFTHIDSKLVKSFKYLLFKPGYLTEAFVAGHRKKYMNPVQLFIVVSLIFFVAVSIFGVNIFTTPLNVQLGNATYGQLVQNMVQKRIAEEHLSFQVFEDTFNHSLKAQAKSLIIVMVPLFSLFLSVLFFRQKRYFVEHLVFSLDFYSFILIAFGVVFNLFFLTVAAIFRSTGHNVVLNVDDDLPFLFITGTLFSFIFLSLRRVYKNSGLVTFIKTIVVFTAFWMIIFAYRFLLFVSVFYSMELPHH